MPRTTTSPIRSIDHVLLHTDAPERVFALFRDLFDFPVVWPMTDYGRCIAPGSAPLACCRACYSAAALAILAHYEHPKSRWGLGANAAGD